VFVLDDGGEVDLDLGNYERYLNITLTKDNNITTGKVYMQVIEAERRGDYLGKTVQVVPHITDKIQDWIARVARIPVDDTNEEPDICIVELGGTVGDIESAPFIEAVRQLKRRAGKNNFLQIHVSLVPLVNGEQKTKPTQQAIRDVRGAGLQPDLVSVAPTIYIPHQPNNPHLDCLPLRRKARTLHHQQNRKLLPSRPRTSHRSPQPPLDLPRPQAPRRTRPHDPTPRNPAP